MLRVEDAPLTLDNVTGLVVKAHVDALGNPEHERVMLDP